MLASILIASFAIMIVSLAGKITIFTKLKNYIETKTALLITLSAGVFSGTLYVLLKELIQDNPITYLALWFIAGILLVHVLSKLIPEYHHHHFNEVSDHTHGRASANRLLLSDGIHNIADGVLVTTTFLSGGLIAFGALISILVHELIQEITEFFVLKQAGYTTKQALIRNFAISAMILIGSIGSYYFLHTFSDFEIPLLSMAAGGFMLALTQDLFPTSIKEMKYNPSNRLLHIIALCVGFALILFSNTFISHGHETHEEIGFQSIQNLPINHQ